MPADVERLRRVRTLFDAAMDQPPGERVAFLEREAGEDPTLRDDVAQLVTLAERTGAPLDTPLAPPPSDAGGLVGQRLGPYDVVRVIGEGGMGAVYEGIRADDQFRKRVAIKLVHRGRQSDLTFARFRRERQILANLGHPAIATLLDGGVTPDGRPFLVMEHVTAEPITAWCDARRLGVRARVELFRQVCAAVRYAHLNLVIHRDLKPANILVTEDGQVKLLDFGIAKLLHEEEDDEAPITRAGARAFTPEYASPEQLRGEPLTTASDVYSLGVVLFELLAGTRPHAVASRALVDIEREVLRGPTPRPSTAATDVAAAARGEATRRHLARRLHGDLDHILLTALAPEPERRYESAESLSDDLVRYLSGRPVRALGGRMSYRAGKFIRRNRWAVAAGAAIVVALVSGVVATGAMARRAQRAQDRSERVSGFLRELLSSVRPVTGGRDVPVSELLDSASSRLASGLETRPDVQAELEAVIGWSYESLGQLEEAERHMRQAVALRRRLYGDRNLATIIAINALGNIHVKQGQLDPADTALTEALALRRALGGGPDTVLATILGNLGSLAHSRSKPADAERYHRESLAIRRQVSDSTDPNLAASLNNVAVSLGEQNRWDEAEAMHREAIGILRRLEPEGGVRVADALNALATALDLQGKPAAAESAYAETLALRRKFLGPTHPDYTFTAFNYAGFSFDQGRYDQAAALSREIVSLRGTALPESHPAVAGALQTLGKGLDKLGDHPGAEAALRESLALRKRHLPADSWLIASSEGVLGEHYAIVQDYPRAEALLLGADRKLSAAQGADSPRTLANVRRLVDLYQAWGRPADAARYRARLGT